MRSRAGYLLMWLLVFVPTTAMGIQNYRIGPMGLVNDEHTRNDGYQYSETDSELNGSGQATGISYRYIGGDTQLGRSAWISNGVTTTHIGLVDLEHTRADGFKSSDAFDLNEAGQAIGWSNRFRSDGTPGGRSAWFYDGVATQKIGLTSGPYTRSDGSRSSEVFKINEAGLASGESSFYNGSTTWGQTAWIYDHGITKVIGLVDGEHTSANGKRWSEASAGKGCRVNEAGQACGISTRYEGNINRGQSAWFYNGTNTIKIGLVDSEHTGASGSKLSRPYGMNEAGQIVGYSERYLSGSSPMGNSAWVFNGTTTIDISLTDVEFTRNDGYRSSTAFRVNEAGQVSGSALRFNGGSTDLGLSFWFYDGATTSDIGLTGSEHTRADGYKWSEAYALLNEGGYVSGFSKRYNGGSTDLGTSAWLYNRNTTIDIGLSASQYTRDDGYRASAPIDLNENGQVIGVTNRYSGSNQLGQDAWFYDPVLNQTIALTASVRSDGYAFSQLNYLGEDGVALGTYTLFDAMDNNLGNRAFYFTIADGLHDLGSMAAGGLPANGWDFLADAVRANDKGQIVGVGKLSSQSGGQMAYLLTPIPEPSSLVLALLGALGVQSRRRRK